jgi:hypothetical protein
MKSSAVLTPLFTVFLTGGVHTASAFAYAPRVQIFSSSSFSSSSFSSSRQYRAVPLRSKEDDEDSEFASLSSRSIEGIDAMEPMGTVTEHYKRLEEEQGIMQSRTPPFTSAELINGRLAMVGATIILSREFLWDGESIPEQVSEAFASLGQAAAAWC